MNRHLLERYVRNCVLACVCLVVATWAVIEYRTRPDPLTTDLLFSLTVILGSIACVLMARAPQTFTYPMIDLIVRKPILDPARARNLVYWAREQKKLEHLELVFQALGFLAHRSGDKTVLAFLRVWGTTPPQSLTIVQAKYCGYAFAQVSGSAGDYELLDSPRATVPTVSSDPKTHFLLEALCRGHPHSRRLLIRWLRSSDLSRCEAALRSLSALESADLSEYLAELPGVLTQWSEKRVAISDYIASWIFLEKDLPLSDSLVEMFLENLSSIEPAVGFGQRGELLINPQVELLISSKVRDEVWREMLFRGAPTMAAIGAVVLVIRRACPVTELVTAYFQHPEPERFLLALRIFPDVKAILAQIENAVQALSEASEFEGFSDERLAVLADFAAALSTDQLSSTRTLFRLLSYAPVFGPSSDCKAELSKWRSGKQGTAQVLCDYLLNLHRKTSSNLGAVGSCIAAILVNKGTVKVGFQAVKMLVEGNVLALSVLKRRSIIRAIRNGVSTISASDGQAVENDDLNLLRGFLSQMSTVAQD